MVQLISTRIAQKIYSFCYGLHTAFLHMQFQFAYTLSPR